MPKTITKLYNFISRRWVILTLAAIVVMAFMLRVVFPLQIVFGDGFVNYLEGDCFSRMWYAKQIQGMPFFEGFTFAVPRGLLFPWLVAMLGYIFPIELVGAWLPPIIACGVIVLVYLIGSDVFNTLVGLASALFVAIIPSEFYHRSLLGYPDHHVAEVFLMALAAYLIIKVIRASRIFNRYSIILGVVLFLYLATWTAGVLLTSIMALMVLIYFFRKASRGIAWSLSCSLLIGNLLYVCLGGFVRYFYRLPGVNDTILAQHSAGMVNETMATVFTPLAERTISELMPLFAPAGSFHLGVVITNLHLFAITFLVGLVFLWFWRKDRANLFMIIWTVIILLLSLNQRRFLYYLTLPVGLLSAWGIYELGQLAKKNSYIVMFFITLLLIMISLPILPLIGMTKAFSMPPEWHDTLVWLKEEPDNGMVTAWSDYGHWIQYTAEKSPNLFNGPGGKNVAKLFLTTDDEEAQVLLEQLNTQYLIVDRDTMARKVLALEIVAVDGKASEDSLAIRLLNGANVPYLEMVYESENIKVYEVKGE